MATLVLTAIGGAVAGPIGAAIGSMAGQQIDQRLFAPRGPEGPRLAQLAVQAAAYGAPLTKVFGTMRVSGSVIWATDLQEQRQTHSQGKGRPKAVTYSYHASFAVALSGRPATRIGRIWADGKLLRGAAGDFKTQTGFRFYSGREDQEVDPLIAGAEDGAAPAYRGVCYAVFEDMALEDFGNRIPILSFELIADAAVTLGDILSELGGGTLEADCQTPVIGFAADGGTVRQTVAPLLALKSLDAVDLAARVRVAAPTGPVRPILAAQLGAAQGPRGGPPLACSTKARAHRASLFRLGYADPARDFQPGEQRAELFIPGRSAARELLLALGAGDARRWALDALLDLRARDEEVHIALPWAALDLGIGDLLSLPERTGIWRVLTVSFDEMRVTARLCRYAPPPDGTPPADAGRGLLAPDTIHGPTRLVLAELPMLDTGVATRPVVVAAAAGPQPGWRQAALSQSADQGARWTDIGATAAPAIFGTAASLLAPVSPHLVDRVSHLVVDLLHDEMALRGVDEDALLAGENLMMVGRELVQFGRAERIGPARYRLTQLLRGRRGTEAEMVGHRLGEDVLLLDRTTLLELEVPAGAARWSVMAAGLDDPAPVVRTIDLAGLATRPLAPMHLSAAWTETGALQFRWVRRSRAGWDWPDGVDAPLAEEREAYRLMLTPEIGPVVQLDLNAPVAMQAAPQISAWRAAGARRLDWQVVQIGTAGSSPPAAAQVAL